MPKTFIYTRMDLEWVQIRIPEDGNPTFRAAFRYRVDANDPGRVVEVDGWDGTTSAQRTALRTALANVLKAKVGHELGTDPATATITQTGSTFTEVAL
jgi:hypothetical protein